MHRINMIYLMRITDFERSCFGSTNR